MQANCRAKVSSYELKQGAVTKFIFGTAPFRYVRIYITGEQSL